jgi:protein TonB
MTKPSFATALKPLSLAVSLTLGLGLAACSKGPPATAAGPAAPSSAEQAAAAQAAQAAQAAAAQAAALASMSADELKKRGNQALREQRLYAPAGDNAMEYFLALRKKSEKPDPSGESALIDLQPYAVIAAEQAISREDFVEAERLRGLIAATDPQAPALPRIADAIAKGKVAAAQKAAQAQTLADQQKAAEEAKAKADQAAAAQAAAAAALAAQHPAPAAPTPTPAAPPPPEPKPVVAAPAPTPAAPARSADLVPISTPQPPFPPDALRDGTAGEVVASYTINADGTVSNVSIVSARPRNVFERTVQSTVKRWKYQPIDKPQTVTRTFSFSP